METADESGAVGMAAEALAHRRQSAAAAVPRLDVRIDRGIVKLRGIWRRGVVIRPVLSGLEVGVKAVRWAGCWADITHRHEWGCLGKGGGRKLDQSSWGQ